MGIELISITEADILRNSGIENRVNSKVKADNTIATMLCDRVFFEG